MGFLFVVAKTVEIFIGLIVFAMLLRVILPLFMAEPEANKFYVLAFFLSELVTAPVRVIFDKFGVGKNSPFDWSFMAAYLFLIIIQSALPAL